MFKVLGILMLLAVLSMLMGLLAHWGTNVGYGVTQNSAATLGLLFIFTCVIISCTSAADYLKIIGDLQSGIPYLSGIADYGSFSEYIKQDTLDFVLGFLDAVFLSAFINLFSVFSPEFIIFNHSNLRGKLSMFPLVAFAGVVFALLGLLALKLVKATSGYKWIVDVVSSVIILLTALPFIGRLIKKIAGPVVAAGLTFMLFFGNGPIAVYLRNTMLKAILLTVGIILVERYCGSLSVFASAASSIIIAFGPLVLLIIAVFVMLSSVLKRW